MISTNIVEINELIEVSQLEDASIIKALRTTLYSLKYKAFQITDELSEDELRQINEYKNKDDFVKLFKTILNKHMSFKDMLLKQMPMWNRTYPW